VLLHGSYIVVMGHYKMKLSGRLTLAMKLLGWPYLLIGYALDVIGNVLLSLLFWELPREWLITSRLKRHMKSNYGWRRKVAEWICQSALDPFDPRGRHCD
jgi:hypothetical protein